MPHHLPALREGYFFGTNPVLRSRAPVSASEVPVFAGDGDGVQCCFNPYFLQAAAQARGEALPPAFADAVTDLRALALELAMTAQFRLSPGDVVLWHNWSWLHGRTAFEDDPEQRRLLLRLWLRSDLCHPADIRFAERSVAIDDDHERTRREGMRVE
jgi:alpha-ketoglutarate-dependent taurine dioxygenase